MDQLFGLQHRRTVPMILKCNCLRKIELLIKFIQITRHLVTFLSKHLYLWAFQK